MKNNYLWKRDYSSNTNKLLIKKFFNNQININNIHKCKLNKLIIPNINYYKDLKQDLLAYIFEILSKWIFINERYTEKYINYLNKIIINLKLENCLNANEMNYLRNINEIIFSKFRKIKELSIKFNKQANEVLYGLYTATLFYQKNINTNFWNTNFKNIRVYISSKNLIISSYSYFINFPLNKINKISLLDQHLIFEYNNQIFIIKSYDAFSIYIFLKRILNKMIENE